MSLCRLSLNLTLHQNDEYQHFECIDKQNSTVVIYIVYYSTLPIPLDIREQEKFFKFLVLLCYIPHI